MKLITFLNGSKNAAYSVRISRPICFSQGEWERIGVAAQQAGMGRADFVRFVSLFAAGVVKIRKSDVKVEKEAGK